MADGLGLIGAHSSEFSIANDMNQATLNDSICSIAAMLGERYIEEEAQQLAHLFKAVTNKAAFARQFKVPGGASMINQHLSGHRPLSLAAATAYAQGLGVPISQFSPRLAALVALAQQASPSTTESTESPDGDKLLSALKDWRMQASAKSQQVIDLLCVLAQNNALREEDWALIEQMATRLKPPQK